MRTLIRIFGTSAALLEIVPGARVAPATRPGLGCVPNFQVRAAVEVKHQQEHGYNEAPTTPRARLGAQALRTSTWRIIALNHS